MENDTSDSIVEDINYILFHTAGSGLLPTPAQSHRGGSMQGTSALTPALSLTLGAMRMSKKPMMLRTLCAGCIIYAE